MASHHSQPSAMRGRRKRRVCEKKQSGYWQPFNDWWRAQLQEQGQRPKAEDMKKWYVEEAAIAFPIETPTYAAVRNHAKGLRDIASVKEYFREYRARKRKINDEASEGSDAADDADPDSGTAATTGDDGHGTSRATAPSMSDSHHSKLRAASASVNLDAPSLRIPAGGSMQDHPCANYKKSPVTVTTGAFGKGGHPLAGPLGSAKISSGGSFSHSIQSPSPFSGGPMGHGHHGMRTDNASPTHLSDEEDYANWQPNEGIFAYNENEPSSHPHGHPSRSQHLQHLHAHHTQHPVTVAAAMAAALAYRNRHQSGNPPQHSGPSGQVIKRQSTSPDLQETGPQGSGPTASGGWTPFAAAQLDDDEPQENNPHVLPSMRSTCGSSSIKMRQAYSQQQPWAAALQQRGSLLQMDSGSMHHLNSGSYGMQQRGHGMPSHLQGHTSLNVLPSAHNSTGLPPLPPFGYTSNRSKQLDQVRSVRQNKPNLVTSASQLQGQMSQLGGQQQQQMQSNGSMRLQGHPSMTQLQGRSNSQMLMQHPSNALASAPSNAAGFPGTRSMELAPSARMQNGLFSSPSVGGGGGGGRQRAPGMASAGSQQLMISHANSLGTPHGTAAVPSQHQLQSQYLGGASIGPSGQNNGGSFTHMQRSIQSGMPGPMGSQRYSHSRSGATADDGCGSDGEQQQQHSRGAGGGELRKVHGRRLTGDSGNSGGDAWEEPLFPGSHMQQDSGHQQHSQQQQPGSRHGSLSPPDPSSVMHHSPPLNPAGQSRASQSPQLNPHQDATGSLHSPALMQRMQQAHSLSQSYSRQNSMHGQQQQLQRSTSMQHQQPQPQQQGMAGRHPGGQMGSEMYGGNRGSRGGMQEGGQMQGTAGHGGNGGGGFGHYTEADLMVSLSNIPSPTSLLAHMWSQ